MSTKTTSIISISLIAITVLAGVLLWNQLPEQMASHWNVNDQVDGTMSKFWGVFMMPLITLGMLTLFLIVPNIDPLKANIAQFREAFNLFVVLIVAFMLYIHGLDSSLEPRVHQLQDERGNASIYGCVIHRDWADAAESQTQFLHRHSHPVDIVQ